MKLGRIGFGRMMGSAGGSPYSDPSYKLALDFKNTRYYVNGTPSALSAMAGYTYTRSGAKSELNASGAAIAFAANEPGIAPGVGYYARGAQTNLLIRSNEITDAVWGASAVTRTADAGVAPDGTTTADRITGDAGSAAKYVSSPTISYTSGATYTFSHFVKYESNRYVQMVVTAAAFGAGKYVNFDLVAGTVGSSSGVTGYIFSLGGGLFRIVCVATATATASGDSYFALIDASTSGQLAAATTTESVLLWGSQAVEGNFLDGGAIIATAGATASIGADVKSITDAPADETQLFWTVIDFPGNVGNRYAAWWGDGTANNYILLGFQGASLNVQAAVGGVIQINQSAAGMTAGRFAILSLRSGGNWRGGYIKNGVLTWNGAAVAGTFPTTTKLNIGSSNTGTSQINTSLPGIFRKTLADTSDAAILAAVGTF